MCKMTEVLIFFFLFFLFLLKKYMVMTIIKQNEWNNSWALVCHFTHWSRRSQDWSILWICSKDSRGIYTCCYNLLCFSLLFQELSRFMCKWILRQQHFSQKYTWIYDTGTSYDMFVSFTNTIQTDRWSYRHGKRRKFDLGKEV